MLLELARVLAAGETQRTIVLVSTSGGSGGNAGAADFAAHADAGTRRGDGRLVDAALVLGDLAGTQPARAPGGGVLRRRRLGPGAAAEHRGRGARRRRRASQAGAPGTLAQLAHLVFPLPAGEQAPLDAARAARGAGAASAANGRRRRTNRSARRGWKASDGRRSPPCTRWTAAEAAEGPEQSLEAGLPIQHKAIPEWALRLLVAALLAAGAARCSGTASRVCAGRTEPVGRWVVWALACALPFLAGALFAIAAGAPRRDPRARARRSPQRRCRSTALRWRRCSRRRSCWCSPGWGGRR